MGTDPGGAEHEEDSQESQRRVQGEGRAGGDRRCHLPTAIIYSDEVELEKSLGAALIAGDSVINIDNVSDVVDSNFLNMMLTQETVATRFLGESRNVDCPTSVLLMSTGNNWTCRGDAVRRVLRCTINPNCEHPENRKFDFDPVEKAREHRMELVTAALTIIRAYIVAGSPKQNMEVYGSYEVWSEWVRAPLIWLGEDDPVVTVRGLQEVDPEKEGVAEVCKAWWQLFQGQEVQSKDLFMAAESCVLTGSGPVFADRHELCTALKTALLDVMGTERSKPKETTTLLVGQWLKRKVNSINHGWRICGKYSSDKRIWVWWLEIVSSALPEIIKDAHPVST